VAASSLAMIGCGDEEVVAYSEPVDLKLGSIKESDATGGIFMDEKNVNTEPGNPYQAFLDHAVAELDGAPPAAILVDRVVVRVGADSSGIGAGGFSEVFADLSVYLGDSATTVVVAALDPVPTGSELEVPIVADRAALEPIRASMISGSLKVGVRGASAASPPAAFDLRTETTITFRALAE